MNPIAHVSCSFPPSAARMKSIAPQSRDFTWHHLTSCKALIFISFFTWREQEKRWGGNKDETLLRFSTLVLIAHSPLHLPRTRRRKTNWRPALALSLVRRTKNPHTLLFYPLPQCRPNCNTIIGGKREKEVKSHSGTIFILYLSLSREWMTSWDDRSSAWVQLPGYLRFRDPKLKEESRRFITVG